MISNIKNQKMKHFENKKFMYKYKKIIFIKIKIVLMKEILNKIKSKWMNLLNIRMIWEYIYSFNELIIWYIIYNW